MSPQGYGGTAFNNSGTLEKTAGSGTTTVDFPLDNTGGTVAITNPARSISREEERSVAR